MDYSTLNSLKNKLEHATSAHQVAIISAEIEKEEQRIREDEAKSNAAAEAMIVQPSILQDNNDTLKKMYEDSQKSFKNSQRLGWITLIIASISMLAAIGSLIVSLINK